MITTFTFQRSVTTSYSNPFFLGILQQHEACDGTDDHCRESRADCCSRIDVGPPSRALGISQATVCSTDGRGGILGTRITYDAVVTGGARVSSSSTKARGGCRSAACSLVACSRRTSGCPYFGSGDGSVTTVAAGAAACGLLHAAGCLVGTHGAIVGCRKILRSCGTSNPESRIACACFRCAAVRPSDVYVVSSGSISDLFAPSGALFVTANGCRGTALRLEIGSGDRSDSVV